MHAEPKATSYTSWFFQNGAGGRATTTHAIKEAKAKPAKPAQITLLDAAYPYTSVKISPKIKEIGKNKTPAPKVITPNIGRSNCEILAGPIMLRKLP